MAEEREGLRCARSECSEQIAERPGLRRVAMSVAVMDMDERAELVDVLDRVLERRLPGGQQDGC